MANKQSPGKGSPIATRRGPGRPKGAVSRATLDIQTAARKHAGDALKALIDVALHGAVESSRVAAATALIDRGYGKPRQAVEHSGPEGGPLDVTVTHHVVDPSAR